jgi:4-hydroxythreonine-4-phosphate dehydrogenase
MAKVEATGNDAPPLVVTMGEPAGIGGEIALMARAAHREQAVPRFFIVDSPERLERLAERLGLAVRPIAIGDAGEIGAAWAHGLPVLPLALPARVVPGRPDPDNAGAVLESIERAVRLVRSGTAGAVVTNPIHKQVLYSAGFHHPGHTEYLAELAGATAAPVMMLACPELRVVPVTIHLPLRRAIEALDTASIVHAGRVTAAALARDLAITRPRLAVTGLNPHAGEGGALGSEEAEIILPAVEALRAEGIAVEGPKAADSLFHRPARQRFDAALCMYHDQALIPLKTLDFEHGVNVTLGLPFVRTSPDHGTALDLAGSGRANPSSLIAALRLAGEMAAARRRATGGTLV